MKPTVFTVTRALNRITKSVAYAMPLVDYIISYMQGVKWVTKLDARSGFWWVPLSEQAQQKVAFSTHQGSYSWNIMPLGIKNSPVTYMVLMNQVLSGMQTYAMAYIDDIIVYTSGGVEDHLEHVEKDFVRLKQHSIKLKLSRCEFLKTEVKYLGFVVVRESIKPDQDKVEAIRGLAISKNAKEVRSLLDACSYFKRFIPNFTIIAERLVALTRKYSKFKWGEKC
jgi:hypothetical protein